MADVDTSSKREAHVFADVVFRGDVVFVQVGDVQTEPRHIFTPFPRDTLVAQNGYFYTVCKGGEGEGEGCKKSYSRCSIILEEF